LVVSIRSDKSISLVKNQTTTIPSSCEIGFRKMASTA
jgi:hypothetical protein